MASEKNRSLDRDISRSAAGSAFSSWPQVACSLSFSNIESAVFFVVAVTLCGPTDVPFLFKTNSGFLQWRSAVVFSVFSKRIRFLLNKLPVDL